MQDSLGAGLMEGTGEGLFPFLFTSSEPAGASLDYHTYTDTNTDSGVILNDTSPIFLFLGETGYGLQWVFPYSVAGASVSVYAKSLTVSPVVETTAMAATASASTITFDFPTSGVTFLVGTWLFYASVTLNGRTDVSSAIKVKFSPAL